VILVERVEVRALMRITGFDVVVTAIAREILAFLWAIAREVPMTD
jgi:hypothetical protein